MIVVTKHSVYVIDGGTLTRYPDGPLAADLSGDRQPIELLDTLTLEVGAPAAFLVQLPDADEPTIRRTTPVMLVEDDD